MVASNEYSYPPGDASWEQPPWGSLSGWAEEDNRLEHAHGDVETEGVTWNQDDQWVRSKSSHLEKQLVQTRLSEKKNVWHREWNWRLLSLEHWIKDRKKKEGECLCSTAKQVTMKQHLLKVKDTSRNGGLLVCFGLKSNSEVRGSHHESLSLWELS